jgi:hypothetical protein
VKLSVSVPDDLWEKAYRRASAGEARPSQLVQEALRMYVAVGGREFRMREYEEKRREEEGDPFTRVLDGLVAGRQAERQRGYGDGLVAAEILGYELVRLIEGTALGFEQVFKSGPSLPQWPSEDESAFLPYLAEEAERSATYRDGAVEAFRDLYEALEDHENRELSAAFEAAGNRDDDDA